MIAADETAEHLAERFHRLYVALEPMYEDADLEIIDIPWARVPTANRNLLIAVCNIILSEDSTRDAA